MIFMQYDQNGNFATEMFVRGFLCFLFCITESMEPFHRVILPEDLWMYKNARKTSYVPTPSLMAIVTLVPAIVFLIAMYIQREKANAYQASLGLSLALCLTGFLTNLVKIIIGRPRPDFFWRCFPDGKYKVDNLSMDCTGIPYIVANGRKSFPSGHSSIAFASLGFTAFYIAEKLQCFSRQSRGQSWRLCLFLLPLVLALMIALSRTCDNHHHWQDVLVGSILGLTLAYLCYKCYCPSFTGANECLCQILPKTTISHSASEALVTVKSV